MRAPTARERTVVLDKIYRMDEDQFRQYWIAKIFRAEVAGDPKIVYSTDMAMSLIAAIRGSITFVPASELVAGEEDLRATYAQAEDVLKKKLHRLDNQPAVDTTGASRATRPAPGGSGATTAAQ